MADIISKDDICNYFDLIGNHDDPDLYLFVKTAEHLCTLDYNCRLPTGKNSIGRYITIFYKGYTLVTSCFFFSFSFFCFFFFAHQVPP